MSTSGKWSSTDQSLHKNCLELLAVSLAVKCRTRDKAQCCVLLKIDNVAKIRYINHVCGRKCKAISDLA